MSPDGIVRKKIGKPSKSRIMKKVLYFAAIALVMGACAKENTVPEVITESPEVPTVETSEYVFTAAPPQLNNEDGTRAFIAEADGSFSWEVGNRVGLTTHYGRHYQFYVSSVENGFATLKSSQAIQLEEGDYFWSAYYDSRTGEPYHGANGALKEGIILEGYVDNHGVISFQYLNAFVHVTFENISPFVTSVKMCLTSGSGETQVFYYVDDLHPSNGSVSAYISFEHEWVKDNFTVSLFWDDGDEESKDPVIAQKTTTNIPAVGALKRLKPVSVERVERHVLYFRNCDSFQIGIDIPSEDPDVEEASFEMVALQDYDETTKYYEIDPAHQIYEGQPLGIYLYDNEGEYLSGTKVYLYRDITFDVSEDFVVLEGERYDFFVLKTNFRIYFDYDFAAPTPTRAFVYLSNDRNLAINGDYPGNYMTHLAGGVYYYEFDSSYFGKTVSVEFSNDDLGRITTRNESFLSEECLVRPFTHY